MPRRRFGQYEVLARLATGGAANIFLARQLGAGGFHNLVCLKTLLPERASDREFVQMFLDEARIAARLNHPNCVEIYDLGREGGTYYISMEYIAGETLWSLLSTVSDQRTPIPPLVVASIIAASCEGLHHAHELTDSHGRPYNLIHRDVSPQNVMVTYEGQTKVLDFGIAKAETGRDPTATGIVKGKFSYMSPEQITGGALDRRSDIYALGIVMFECLASRRLYRADTPEEIARMMVERRPPKLRDLVPDVDPRLEAICNKALARHPQGRFATAREMADALSEVLHASRVPEGTAAVAKVIEERFGQRIASRRRLLQRALEEDYDESELIAGLNARPVMEIDLSAGSSDALLAPIEIKMQERGMAGGSLLGEERIHESLEIQRPIRLDGPYDDSATEYDDSETSPLEADSTVLADDEKRTFIPSELIEPSGEEDLPEEVPRLVSSSTTQLDTEQLEVDTHPKLEELPVGQLRRTPRAGSPRVTAAPPSARLETQPPPARIIRRPPPAGRTSDPPVGPPPLRKSDQPDADRALPKVRIQSGVSTAADDSGGGLIQPHPEPMSPPMPVPMALPDLGAPSGAALAVAPIRLEAPPEGPPGSNYSRGVVIAAMAFGIALGLLIGVLISLFR